MVDLVGMSEKGARIGETHPRAKLSDADVDLIRDLHEAGLSYRQIVAKFDEEDGPRPSKSTVRDIVKCRRRWGRPVAWKRVYKNQADAKVADTNNNTVDNDGDNINR